MTIKQLERRAVEEVRKLRVRKLKNGMPFMINSSELPSTQCYLEYPNGTINIVTICHKNYDFKVIKELTFEEANSLRKKYNLPEI